MKEGRQLYVVQIEGSSVINGEALVMRDAAEAIEEDIHIEAKEQSHYLAIELKNNNTFMEKRLPIGKPLLIGIVRKHFLKFQGEVLTGKTRIV